MKPLIVALLLFLAAAASAGVYADTDNAQTLAIQHATDTIGQPFAIPDDPRIANPTQTYSALLAAAEKAGLNVFRTSVGYAPGGSAETTHFALLVEPTSFFSSFHLQSGRFLGPADMAHPERFLAAAATSQDGQVGTLKVFGGDSQVSIRSLVRAFDSLPVAGRYIVETSDDATYEAFLAELATQLSEETGVPGSVQADSLYARGSGFRGSSADFGPLLAAAELLAIFFVAILLTFRVLHESKRIGILRLHGFGAIDVWYESHGRQILACLVVCEGIALVLTQFVPGTTEQFTADVGLAILRAFGVMIAASVLASLYVATANVPASLKNRKDTQRVFALNSVIKAGSSIALIVVVAGLWQQYSDVTREQSRLGGWQAARGYGIFYPKSVGNDLVDLETESNAETATEVYDLYPALNARGALYVDTTQYSAANSSAMPTGSYGSLVVNVNYLKRFPILGTSGLPIQIAETEADWVVLAPEQYRTQEAALETFFQCQRTGCNGGQGAAQADQAVFGRPASASVGHQRVKIVWYSAGQEIFTFDPAINPDSGNVLADPIVQVLTTGNSVGIDRANMLSGADNSALKMPLLNGDTVATMREIEPTLRQLKLDDNLQHLITMDEYASQRLQALSDAARSLAILGSAFVLLLLLLAAQSASIVFQRYARRITVRRLFGSGFFRTYREAIGLMAAVWAVQGLGAAAVAAAGFNPFPDSAGDKGVGIVLVCLIAATVILAEVAFCSIVLIGIERRSVVRIVKEEF